MPATTFSNAVPKNLEWWGIGRELAAGTLVAPSITVPLSSGDPDDQMNMLVDKALRGDMGEDYNEIIGTQIGQFSLAGNVYLDSFGALLYNLFGDYSSTGTAMTSVGTVTGSLAVGANGATPVTLTAPSGSAPFFFQVGTALNAEVITCSAASVSSITITAPGARLTHLAGATLKQVQAPFTHVFSVLNGGGVNGQSPQAQPVTHTITHNSGLAAQAGNPTFQGQRQYGYWCAAGMDVTMNLSNLFQHATKGVSFFGQDVLVTPFTNSQSDAGAQPNWRFTVQIGGTASGGTITSGVAVPNVEQTGLSIVRQVVPKYTLTNQQNPSEIVRMGLSSTGRLTYVAQDEGPLLTYIAGTQQPLVFGMNNGLLSTNALYQSLVFQYSRAMFEAATLSDPDVMAYDVGFRALMNTNDVGMSGARSPMLVTLINAVPSY